MPHTRCEHSVSPVLAGVLLPRSIFANVIKLASAIQFWTQRLDASYFSQVGNFRFFLANKQAWGSRNVGKCQQEQLVVLMPTGCPPAASIGQSSPPSLSVSRVSPADPLLSVLWRMASHHCLATPSRRSAYIKMNVVFRFSITLWFVLCPNFKRKKHQTQDG